ncbi:MAG TPA: FHA domain-containing protein [Pirellulaceae bacterium]|nr:FHA domain-containing protein [Pirellulaceae bacterium]
MQVRLKILQGSKAGTEIKIPGPECLIGRGDDCHLRTQADAVSRRHCVIRTTENEVAVRDLGSRNGTFVNGEQITGDAVLLNGDQLRVGPLEFQVIAEQTAGKAKRPKVAGIKEVAARTANPSDSSGNNQLGDVADWLDEAEQAEKDKRVADPETRQFHLDDTAHNLPVPTGTVDDGETKALDAQKRPEKKSPGKLPPRPSTSTKDSREAASDMLKKFFNRR